MMYWFKNRFIIQRNMHKNRKKCRKQQTYNRRRISIYEKIIYSENNDNMTSSYIMLDAKGRFFNNIDNK
ncbi:hypothetical protein [Brachyspira sp.]|uniref:hypothetical protein n=1 Tax=Brachyspira sp. TaxID=1977261 RepID=UPI00261C41F8|nr:hypothetical protein [Brachyspira sp.]